MFEPQFLKFLTKIAHFKPSSTTFSGLNFLRVLLHRQNKMKAKKIITPALAIAI